MKEEKKHSVAILGSGESGMGALRLALKNGHSCFLSDFSQIPKEIKSELENLNVSFEEGGHTISKLMEYDEIIKSPGIPQTAVVITELKKAGVSIISEIEYAARYTDAKIIGITGSNGKTTTTLLTAHLLKSAGLNVASAGNVGNSFANLLVSESPDVIVLELSSFQLDDIKTFRPDLGIILNITPDHLDRYGNSIDQYADAKMNLAQNMSENQIMILNTDDPMITARLGRVKCETLEISTQSYNKNGAYLEDEHLIFDTEKDIQILAVEELSLIGRHNYYNQMAAILVAIEMGVGFNDIYQGLKTFKNVPHRLESVAEINNVKFINDSKATNVDAVFYALEAMERKVIWIAGGVNKGNDYKQIKGLVKEKVRCLICLGSDNEHLIQEFSDIVEKYIEVDNAEMAVAEAFLLAQPGDVVLLSPACASFDLFSSYEDRGDLFKKAVIDLKETENLKEVNI